MITVNWTIDVGTIVQIISIVTTVVGCAFWLGRRLTRMEMKINIMWAWWLRHMGLDAKSDEIQAFFGHPSARDSAG